MVAGTMAEGEFSTTREADFVLCSMSAEQRFIFHLAHMSDAAWLRRPSSCVLNSGGGRSASLIGTRLMGALRQPDSCRLCGPSQHSFGEERSTR